MPDTLIPVIASVLAQALLLWLAGRVVGLRLSLVGAVACCAVAAGVHWLGHAGIGLLDASVTIRTGDFGTLIYDVFALAALWAMVWWLARPDSIVEIVVPMMLIVIFRLLGAHRLEEYIATALRHA